MERYFEKGGRIHPKKKKKAERKKKIVEGLRRVFLTDFYYLIPAETQGTKRGEIEIQK